VIQRRLDKSESFRKDWREYKYFFGRIDEEFWLGKEFTFIMELHISEFLFRLYSLYFS